MLNDVSATTYTLHIYVLQPRWHNIINWPLPAVHEINYIRLPKKIETPKSSGDRKH